MNRRDHTVMPDSILRSFRGEEPKISILNLKNLEIEEKPTDKIFVERNYYDEDVDKFIRDNIKTQIGNFRSKIEQGKDLTEDEYKDMELIFFIQYFRNNMFSKKILNSELSKIFSRYFLKRLNHNDVLRKLIHYFMTGQVYDENIKKLFVELRTFYSLYKPGFLIISNTDRSIILPGSQISYIIFPQKEEKYFIFPISPKIALIWKYIGDNNDEDNPIRYITENKAVEILNEKIIEAEIRVNCDNVVFGRKEEIQIMQKVLKKNQNKE